MDNIYAYTPPGSMPPFLSVNEVEDKVFVTVRGVDGAQGLIELPLAEVLALSDQLHKYYSGIRDFWTIPYSK